MEELKVQKYAADCLQSLLTYTYINIYIYIYTVYMHVYVIAFASAVHHILEIIKGRAEARNNRQEAGSKKERRSNKQEPEKQNN